MSAEQSDGTTGHRGPRPLDSDSPHRLGSKLSVLGNDSTDSVGLAPNGKFSMSDKMICQDLNSKNYGTGNVLSTYPQLLGSSMRVLYGATEADVMVAGVELT